ncbi:MAG: hypothetical protein ACE15E_25090 [Acidobacteriota bacterium]
MDLAVAISLASLVVALAAIPASYFTAVRQVRQVRLAIAEQQRNQIRDACTRTNDCLEELIQVFKAGALQITGLTPEPANIPRINLQMREIDVFVLQTGVAGRLSAAIDSLWSCGLRKTPDNARLCDALRELQNQINLGSRTDRLVTPALITAAADGTVQEMLRAESARRVAA